MSSFRKACPDAARKAYGTQNRRSSDRPGWAQPARNLARAGDLVASSGADVALLPEMFATGFCTDPAAVAEPARRRCDPSAPCAAGRTVRLRRRRQRRRGRAGGFPQPHVFRRAFGTTTHYDKRHLFSPGGEARGYLPGGRAASWSLPGRALSAARLDLLPVWSRCRGDYDAILCCASWPASRRDAWRTTCLGARAIENQCFVAAANRVGCDPAAHYAGDSALVDFRGRTLAEAGAEACTLTGAFDPAAAGEFREAFPAGRDADEFVLG